MRPDGALRPHLQSAELEETGYAEYGGSCYRPVTTHAVWAAAEKALLANGIEITAVHNHMLDEEPRLFFMHFWANDDVGKLSNGLRAALDKVRVSKVAANPAK